MCGSEVLDSDISISGFFIGVGFLQLCSFCHALNYAELTKLERFEPARFEPVEVIDCQGIPHEFRLRLDSFGLGVTLKAYEIRDGMRSGYEFQVIGDQQDLATDLAARLLAKIRRALSVKHLVPEEGGLRIAGHNVVQGLLELDECEGLPYLNIDGRLVTWNEFGRMLLSHEGQQFKLEIRDKSEEYGLAPMPD